MVVNQKVTGKASTMPVGLAAGAGISLALTLLGGMLFGKLLSDGIIEGSAIGYCAMVILLAASWGGAVAAYGRIKRRRLFVCAFSAVIYFLLLLGATLLLFDGRLQGVGTTAAMIALGSLLAALPGSRGGKSRRKVTRKIRH